jgi:transposase InsO family protein
VIVFEGYDEPETLSDTYVLICLMNADRLHNGTPRREVLNAEWFASIDQAKTVVAIWLKQYNHIRPHQSLNMRPPVPETLSKVDT